MKLGWSKVVTIKVLLKWKTRVTKNKKVSKTPMPLKLGKREIGHLETKWKSRVILLQLRKMELPMELQG